MSGLSTSATNLAAITEWNFNWSDHVAQKSSLLHEWDASESEQVRTVVANRLNYTSWYWKQINCQLEDFLWVTEHDTVQGTRLGRHEENEKIWCRYHNYF